MLKWNKKLLELSMGDAAEEKIRKSAIVAAVLGFFAHLSLIHN